MSTWKDQIYMARDIHDYGGGASSSHMMVEGDLILPPLTKGESKEITIADVNIVVTTGDDLFEYKGNTNLVIPYFEDGMLFTKMKEINKIPEGHNIDSLLTQENVVRFPSYVTGINQFILYRYDKTMNHWEQDLEKIATLCQDGSILVLPTLGVRNGVSFFDSASRIFYGILACFSNENSPMKKFSKIIVTTKFSENQNQSGVRTIKHLFNLLTIYQKTKDEPECVVCCDMKRSVILNCGHRILCARCTLDIRRQNSGLCPLCKTQITRVYPCYTVTDVINTPCCGKPKSGTICVPCGHYNATCHDCDKKVEETHNCPICHEYVSIVLKLFQ